jgi:hypothetical protein
VSAHIAVAPGHPADGHPSCNNFNWKSLSVAAGLTSWNFYFRIYAGAVKKEQVVDFLEALMRHLRRPLLVVWDRLPAHRSRLVQDYIAGLQGWGGVRACTPHWLSLHAP